MKSFWKTWCAGWTRASAPEALGGGLLAGVLLLGGCASVNAPLPEVDWATYQANPGQYGGQRTLIRVDVPTVNANPKSFSDKELILRGRIKDWSFKRNQADGFNEYYRWYLLLDSGAGEPLRCYEETYRQEMSDRVLRLVEQAARDKGEIELVGRYKPGYGLELDWITYGEQTLDTDVLPQEIPRFFPF